MAEQTPTPLSIDTVSTQLRKFIEGGNLNRIIQSDQIPLYEKCVLVDFFCILLHQWVVDNSERCIQLSCS